MKYYFKSKSKKYLLATILLLSLCPLLGLTYSSFIFSSDNYRASEMYIGSLMYGIKINDESVSKITVEPGETEVNIQITSLNTVSSFYKLIYKENSNILVEYNEDNDLPSGSISNKKEITIKITNSSSSNIEVEFDIASGYITNTLDNVIIPNGYKEVTGIYIVNDINIVALYVDGEKVDTLDSSTNYELESYTCTNNETVTWNNDTKAITIKPITETTGCTLNFKIKLFTIYEKILADNPTIKDDNADLFANVADEVSESGLFRTTDLTKTEDVDGDGTGEEVLYFRGAVTNNYVVFAGYCWRIVRTNESGESIKLRYGGELNGTKCPQTGTEVNINNTNTDYSFGYNAQYNDYKYVKWVHEDGMDSNAKTQVETWYTNEIETQGEAITNLIIDEPYCNDTSVGRISGNYTLYGAYTRLVDNRSPQYKCPNASDKYTVDATKGNGKLSKPIALLTADEVAFAGGVYGTSNSSYYLNIGSYYWTMSPFDCTGSSAAEFNVLFSGRLDSNVVANTSGLLPSVSLSSEAMVADGTTGVYNNPYVIVTE